MKIIDKHDPYEKRTPCKYCNAKGYLKIIKNDYTNKYIKECLERDTKRKLGYVEMTFLGEVDVIKCYCQLCGEISSYYIEEGLFADGVIKEI